MNYYYKIVDEAKDEKIEEVRRSHKNKLKEQIERAK